MQQSSFCVFSGKGVLQLRAFLTELFDHMTEMNGTDDTEYDEDDFEPDDEMPDPEIGEEAEDEDTVQEIGIHREDPSTRGNQSIRPNPIQPQLYEYSRQPQSSTVPPSSSRSANVGPYTTGQGFAYPSAGPAWRPRDQHHPVTTMADSLPIIERNNSASPSTSERSGGTNNSNGATFFRTYQDASLVQPAFVARNEGTLTPDLDFAEIGHGRGMQAGPHGSSSAHRYFFNVGAQQSSTGHHHHHHHHHRVIDSAHSVDQYSSSGEFSQSWTQQESSAQGSTYALLARDTREGAAAVCLTDRRGRSVRKSIRNKLSAAEQYASSFFGRSAPDDNPRRGGGGRPEPNLL